MKTLYRILSVINLALFCWCLPLGIASLFGYPTSCRHFFLNTLIYGMFSIYFFRCSHES